MPDKINGFTNIINFLSEQENDLTDAAISIVPDIALVLEIIGAQDGCNLARMSGSGATCFGLFSDEDEASYAVDNIIKNHPEWWVRSGVLNRTERY